MSSGFADHRNAAAINQSIRRPTPAPTAAGAQSDHTGPFWGLSQLHKRGTPAGFERAAFSEGGTDGECILTEGSFANDHTGYCRALLSAAGPAAAGIFHHGDGVTQRQIDANLGAGDCEELRLAGLQSYGTSDE